MTNQSITYKDAGVDIDASNAAKRRIRDLARKTFTPGVLSDIGAFGAHDDERAAGVLHDDDVLIGLRACRRQQPEAARRSQRRCERVRAASQ